jgi:hypothetical protein
MLPLEHQRGTRTQHTALLAQRPCRIIDVLDRQHSAGQTQLPGSTVIAPARRASHSTRRHAPWPWSMAGYEPYPPFCIVLVKVDLRPVAAHNRHSCAGYDARARGGTDAVLPVIGRIRLQSGRVVAG